MNVVLKEYWKSKDYKFILGVNVPVTTLCPCSKEISDYGAHNQRTIVKVRISYDLNSMVWIEDLIEQSNNAAVVLFFLF